MSSDETYYDITLEGDYAIKKIEFDILIYDQVLSGFIHKSVLFILQIHLIIFTSKINPDTITLECVLAP